MTLGNQIDVGIRPVGFIFRILTIMIVGVYASRNVEGACSVLITNPSSSVTVSAIPPIITLQGTANAGIHGLLTWTNAVAGVSGSVSAATNWAINDIPLVLGTNIITVSGVDTIPESTNGVDTGMSSTYNNGWTNNSNGGSGYNGWSLSTTAGGSANGGFFMATGGNLNIGPKAWGMYANSGNLSAGIRTFTNSLLVGQRVTIRMQNNSIQSGGGTGVALQNSTGTNLWQFWFIGGESNYKITGGTTDIGWTSAGFDISVTLTSTNTYSAEITPLGGTTRTFSGNLGGTGGSKAISRLRAWNSNTGSGSGNNFYINDLYIINPPVAGDGCSDEVSVTRDPAPLNLYINEFMSSNASSITDEDGDNSDWIEILNAGIDAVNLDGFGLSDDAGSPFKWTFPSVNINPGEYLLIWASDKNRRPAQGEKTNGITREVFYNISGTGVSNLTTNSRYPNYPSERSIVRNLFECLVNTEDDNYGQRVHGYIRAPASGNYRFWIASDDNSELRLSTDENPGNAVLIARVPGWTSSREWTKYSEQESADIPLVEGQYYYISAIMKEGTGDDNLAVGWRLPNSTLQRPIPGEHLYVDRELHANYAISAGGETLQLTAPNSVILDASPSVPLPGDVSYGRSPNSTNVWLYYDRTSVTPGFSNTLSGFAEVLPAPVYSVVAGMYTTSFPLGLSIPVTGATIRYTTDGSIPTTNSPLYTNALTIASKAGQTNDLSQVPSNNIGSGDEAWLPPAGEVFKINTIRARAFKSGAMPSPIATSSYLIHSNGTNRFSLPVFSITTDKKNFFDPNIGIYVYGNAPGGNYFQRGMEWERPAHVEFFEEDGSLAFAQDAGVRLHGNLTRNRPRKGLRIYARAEYGESWFEYPLFPDKSVNRYKRFLLRASGNDWDQSQFRDGFMHTLMKNSGVDVQYSRPAIVFLNGEYWGLHNIRDRFDERYLDTHYATGDEMNITMLENNSVFDRGDAAGVDHYEALRSFMNAPGVVNPTNFQYVETQMDVDNFIGQQAARIYFRDTDWPGNNQPLWRYATTNYDPQAPNGLDGRWRWMINDVDFGFSLDFGYVYDSASAYGPNDASHNTLAFAVATNGLEWPNPPWSTYMLRKLLENTDFRARFVNQFADYLNSRFASNHVAALLDATEAQYAPEIAEHIHRWRRPSSAGSWSDNVQLMRNFALARPAYMRNHIINFFAEISGERTLTVGISDTNAGVIRINNLIIHPDSPGVGASPYPWSGVYFEGAPVPFTALPNDGFKFIGWRLDAGGVAQGGTDNTTNYPNSTNWSNSSSGGTGFGSWSLEKSNSPDSGYFVGGTGGRAIHGEGPDGRSFGIFGHSGQWATANRAFSDGGLNEGDTFSILVSFDEFVGAKGLIFTDGASERFRFSANNNPSNQYVYNMENTSNVVLNSTFAPAGNSTFAVSITRQGGVGFPHFVSINRGTNVLSGTFNLNGPVKGFRLYNSQAGSSADGHNLYFNLINLSRAPSGATNQIVSTNLTYSIGSFGDTALTAIFTTVAPSVVIHYWNFNNSGALLAPSYTVGGAAWTNLLGPSTEVLSGTGQDFFGENARFGDPVGSHLRVNNPIGATSGIDIATTGYEDIRVKYETRRSGSGAGSQIIDYTLDGSNYTSFATISPVDGVPVIETLNFSNVAGASDNPNFGLRITFAQGGGGTVGNNRLDNFTVEGRSLGEVNLPPEVEDSPGTQFLIENDMPMEIDLDEVFSDPNEDTLVYEASSDNSNVVTVGVSGHTLTIHSPLRGEAHITITADDGINTPAELVIRALVYPEAFALETGSIAFSEWATNQPAGSYPDHMIFLQGNENDSSLATDLVFAYRIPPADAAQPADADFPYAAASRTRLNGLGTNGISLINTGRGRDLGGALLALDTRNVTNASVGWLGGTVTPNVRVYAIRLQYRLGVIGDFIDVLDGSSNPVEYIRNALAGHIQPFDPVLLPEDTMGEEYVQVLWRYYLVSGSSGARAELRLDDILAANEDGDSMERMNFVRAEFSVSASIHPEWAGRVMFASENSAYEKIDSGVAMFAQGQVAEIFAAANEYFTFSGWSGDDIPAGNENDNPLALRVNRDVSITANFSAEVTENTGTPHWWLAHYQLRGEDFEAQAMGDHNGNGLPAWMEYLADLNPADPNSKLPAINLRREDEALIFEIRPTSTARVYSIMGAAELQEPVVWTTITDSTGTGDAWIRQLDPDQNSNRFYRSKISLPKTGD